MIIERPVYFVVVEGNIKYHASQIPSTMIASYEEHIDKTYVVVKAGDEDFSNDVKKHYERINSGIKKNQVEVQYLKNGIEFKTYYGK